LYQLLSLTFAAVGVALSTNRSFSLRLVLLYPPIAHFRCG